MLVSVPLVLLLWPVQLPPPPTGDLPRGTIIQKIVCKDHADQSYALYLPSTYSPDRKWPILYAFDPAARGQLPVQRFRDAAERHGFIVVGSNNSRNGPMGPVQDALNAVLADTRARFSLDRKRVYLVGFSGGARAAVLIGKVLAGEVAGVIGFGAGFHEAVTPSAALPFAYFGAAGVDDFNYPEMRDLDRALGAFSIPHRLDIFEGAHEWPPERVCTRAIQWMELQAIKSGLVAGDHKVIEELSERAVAEASSDESAGHLYQAFSQYSAATRDFAGLRDVSLYGEKARQLERSRAVRQAVRDLDESVDAQHHLQAQTVQLANDAITGQDPVAAFHDLIAALAQIKKQSDDAKPSADRMAARRILAWLWMELNQAASRDLERGEYQTAAIRLRVMTQMRPENAVVEYNLACAQARAGNKKQAIEALQRAVAKGFADADRLESDPDLASLRGDNSFRALAAALKKTASPRRNQPCVFTTDASTSPPAPRAIDACGLARRPCARQQAGWRAGTPRVATNTAGRVERQAGPPPIAAA